MATNPESSEDRDQGFIRRTVEIITQTAGSRSWRRLVSIPLAAAFGSLAPEPFGQIAAALVAVIALETR
jgi:hypothetical protein